MEKEENQVIASPENENINSIEKEEFPQPQPSNQ